MKIYPVRVPRSSYRGSDAGKRRKATAFDADALSLERYLNERIDANPAPVQQYIYGNIAQEIGMPEERVREILFAVDGGHNGLTVAKTASYLPAQSRD